MDRCPVDGCDNPVRPHRRICESHRSRLKRGLSMGELRPYRQTPKQALLAAISHLYEQDPMDGEAWEKAWHRVRVYARRYVLADKPTDPRGKPVNNSPRQPNTDDT